MKKTVCVDLDGVIAKYEDWQGIEHFGEPLPGAKEFLVGLRKIAKVMIFTTRGCESANKPEPKEKLEGLIRAFLDEHDLPCDEIWTGQGKPIAVAYIDDNAIECRPQDDPKAFQEALAKVAIKVGKKDLG